MSLTAGTRLGKYRLDAVIGAGGMGVVYRAKDLQLLRDVAIKVLPENLAEDRVALKRLEREARVIAALSHPNILSIHDFDTHEGIAFVVMELLEGRNLKQVIQERRFSFEEAVEIGTAIAEGLHAAHSKGIIHRDLKPDNVFLTSDSRVKILDFGLAILKPVLSGEDLSKASTDSAIRDEGINGTVPYMSPEQLRGKAMDSRSDIFSFGSVFYEMIVGHPPFLRETVADSISAILHEDPAYDGVPSQAIRIVSSCLQKDPDQRMHDAHHLVTALTKTSSSPLILPAGKPPVVQRRWKSMSLIASFTVLAALLLAYLNSSFFRNPSKINSVAVLPLKNMSGDPQDEYFADGMTDEITSRLARISTIRVISRTSAMQYKGVLKNVKQIGRELDVDVLLEGSVRRTGGKIRLLTNLIDADTDRNIWSKTYEEDMPDILQLQNELAREVARELKATLTPFESTLLSSQQNILPEAYDAYLSGLSHERKEDYSLESVLKQIDMFRQAVELDPDFAAARASLSRAHSTMHHFRFQPEVDHARKAKEAVDRALEIDPDLPEARLALGYYYYWCVKDYGRALNQFGLARKALPNDTTALEGIAYILRRQGNCDEALNTLQKALVLSPRDLRIVNQIANTLSMLRRYDEADQYYERAINLSPDQIDPYFNRIENYYLWDGTTERAGKLLETLPSSATSIEWFWTVHYFYSRDYETLISFLESRVLRGFDNQHAFAPKEQLLATAYRLSSRPEHALRYYKLAKNIVESKYKSNADSPTVLSSLGFVYAGLGYTDRAIEMGRRGFEVVPMMKDSVGGTFRGMDLAKIYVMTGRYEEAMNILEYLLTRPGFVSVKLLQLDPEFKPLQQSSRFQKLVQRYATN
ncbi:protein kinase [bacterium]|nr:protein kinase [bacterium]